MLLLTYTAVIKAIRDIFCRVRATAHTPTSVDDFPFKHFLSQARVHIRGMEIQVVQAMNNKAVRCKLFFLGEKTVQTTFLANFLNLNLAEYDVRIDYLIGSEKITVDEFIKIVLVDYSVISQEILLSFLESIIDDIFVAILNAKKDEFHDDFLKWPCIRGVFYNDTNQDHLVKGLKAILAGEIWFSRDLMGRYLQRHRTTTQCSPELVNSTLTEKELQILSYVVTGLSNKEIANCLDISDGTVKTHIYNIFKKIQVKNRVQAANWLQSKPAFSNASIN